MPGGEDAYELTLWKDIGYPGVVSGDGGDGEEGEIEEGGVGDEGEKEEGAV